MTTKLESQNALLSFSATRKSSNQESQSTIKKILVKGLEELDLNVDSYDIREKDCSHIEIGLRGKDRFGFFTRVTEIDQKIRSILKNLSIPFKREMGYESLEYALNDPSVNLSITDISDYYNPDPLFFDANEFFKAPLTHQAPSFKELYERVSKSKDGKWIEGVGKEESLSLLKASLLFFADKISFCKERFLCEFEEGSLKHSLLIPSFNESDRQALSKHFSLFTNKLSEEQGEKFAKQLISECSINSNKAHFFFEQIQKLQSFIYLLPQGSKIVRECIKNLKWTDSFLDQLDALSRVDVVREFDALFWKDLLVSFFERLPNETIHHFFDCLRNHSGLFKSDKEKLIYRLHTFSKQRLTPSLIRGDRYPLLGILELDGKEIRESKNCVSKFFTKSKKLDPFNFDTNLALLLSSGEINKALNLLLLQEHLVGFSCIQTSVQKILQSSVSEINQEEVQKLYFGFVEEVLMKEVDEKKKLEMALTAYGYLYSNSEIANRLEKRCFLGKLDTSLFEDLLQQNEELKGSCKIALTYRIERYLEALKPVPVCTLLNFLSKISTENWFVSSSLVGLLDKSRGDSKKTNLSLEHIHACFSKEIRQLCLLDLLGTFNENEENGDLIGAFLSSATDEDKMILIEGSSGWTLKSLEKCLNVLGKTEGSARLLFSRISARDFFTAEGLAFIRRLSPYLNDADKETALDKISGFEGFSSASSGNYLKFVEEVIMKGKSSKEKLEIALKTYRHLYSNAEIAQFLEKKYLLTASLEDLLKQEEGVKGLCKEALTYRIEKYLEESKPVLSSELLELLSKFSNDTAFMVKSLVSSLEKCNGDPQKIERCLHKILQCSKGIQQQCFVGLLALFDKKEGVGDLLKPFLSIALDKDKLTLVRKCMEKLDSKIHAELFHASINALSDLKKVFKESFHWNVKSLEKCFEVLDKTEVNASTLFGQISKIEFFKPEGLAFIKRLSPYLSDTAKGDYLNTIWSAVNSMIQANQSIKDTLPYLALMLNGDPIPWIFEGKVEQKVQEKFISLFIAHLEKLHKCLIDKNSDLSTRENRKNAQTLIDQMKAYALPFLREEQKVHLLYRYCSSSCDLQIDLLVKNAAEQISDFKELRGYKWDSSKLVRGLTLLSSSLARERYESFALEECSSSPLAISKDLLFHMSKSAKAKLLLQSSHFIKNRGDIEIYLPTIMELESSYFSENPKLYAAFLKIACLYVSPSDFSEKESDVIKKIREINQAGDSLFSQLEEGDQLLHQLTALF